MARCCQTCSVTIFKFILVLVNVVFLLAGLAILGSGAAGLYMKTGSVGDVPIPEVHYVFIAAVVLGSFVLFTACCGCCGAFVESKIMLCTYFCIVFLIVAGQVAVAAVAANAYSHSDVTIDSAIKSAWNNADDAEREDMMAAGNCCGFNSVRDDGCANLKVDVKARPCAPVYEAQAKQALYTAALVAAIVAGVELLCLLTAMCLMCCIPKKSRDDLASRPLINESRGYDPVPAYQGTYAGRKA